VGREAFGFDAVERSQREDNHKARRAFRSAPNLAARPRLRVTRSEIMIHEFGRHRHHDQSKNPANHTTGSKLAPREVVLKFDLDAIHRSIMQTMELAGRYQPMFAFFSNRLGCLGSIVVSVI